MTEDSTETPAETTSSPLGANVTEKVAQGKNGGASGTGPQAPADAPPGGRLRPVPPIVINPPAGAPRPALSPVPVSPNPAAISGGAARALPGPAALDAADPDTVAPNGSPKIAEPEEAEPRTAELSIFPAAAPVPPPPAPMPPRASSPVPPRQAPTGTGGRPEAGGSWLVRCQELFRHRQELQAAAGVLGFFFVLYLVAIVYAGSGVPRGTSVLGVDVGGMSPTAAASKLEEGLGAKVATPLEVRVGDRTLRVDPRAAGLSVDIPATVDVAAKRSLNPFTLIPRLFGAGNEVTPERKVDTAALTSAVARLSGKVDQKTREGTVVFRGGRPVAVEPRQGRVLDRPGAVAAIRAGYLRGGGPLTLPTRISEPRVSQAEVDRIMSGWAKTAVSGPVELTMDPAKGSPASGNTASGNTPTAGPASGNTPIAGPASAGPATVSVPAKLIAGNLSLHPDKTGKLRPRLDQDGFKKDLASRLAKVEQPPRDATFQLAGGKPAVVESAPGHVVPAKDLAKAVLDVLGKPSDRTAEVELVAEEPKLTTEKAQALGITQVVGTFTTRYPFAPYRLQNIHRAADLIRGTVILPRQTWSLNATVGERTAANGFARGVIIKDGRFAVDYGGGTSQLATTTFNAAFFAGLKIVQHKPHSFYINRYPEGREATVVWGATDLKIRNDMPNGIYIDASYTNDAVTVTLWGTPQWKIETTKSARYNVKPPKTVNDPSPNCEKQEPAAGFDVDVWRIFKGLSGGEVRREKFHTRYNPADHIVCGQQKAPPPPGPGAPPPPGSDRDGRGGNGGGNGGDSD